MAQCHGAIAAFYAFICGPLQRRCTLRVEAQLLLCAAAARARARRFEARVAAEKKARLFTGPCGGGDGFHFIPIKLQTGVCTRNGNARCSLMRRAAPRIQMAAPRLHWRTAARAPRRRGRRGPESETGQMK